MPIIEMVDTINMFQYFTLDEMSGIINCFYSISSQTYIDEPIHKFSSRETIFIDFNPPSEIIYIT